MTDNWQSIMGAMPSGLTDQQATSWRIEIINRLLSGMLPARATRMTERVINRYVGLEFTGKGESAECWDGKQAMAMQYPSNIETKPNIKAEFWDPRMANLDSEWSDIDCWRMSYANWETGDFAEFSIHAGSERLSSDADTMTVKWFVDVQVDSHLLKIFNQKYQSKKVPQKTSRNSKYDWVSAIAHLVGIAELDSLVDDPHAHGALAKVEKAIADWFAAKTGDQPSEAAIRPYANKVLASIKEADQKDN